MLPFNFKRQRFSFLHSPRALLQPAVFCFTQVAKHCRLTSKTPGAEFECSNGKAPRSWPSAFRSRSPFRLLRLLVHPAHHAAILDKLWPWLRCRPKKLLGWMPFLPNQRHERKRRSFLMELSFLLCSNTELQTQNIISSLSFKCKVSLLNETHLGLSCQPSSNTLLHLPQDERLLSRRISALAKFEAVPLLSTANPCFEREAAWIDKVYDKNSRF